MSPFTQLFHLMELGNGAQGRNVAENADICCAYSYKSCSCWKYEMI